ncbi:MAG: discoidin domain-containing protein, partial [Verrucomicrobiales bacterium]
HDAEHATVLFAGLGEPRTRVGADDRSPQAALPELGPNDARLGTASALASGAADATSPGRAIDGKPATYWESDAPGPASWQMELPDLTPVGAVALIWKNGSPPEFVVEGSNDGRSWRNLTPGSSTEGESTLSVLSFNPLELSHLRVSIPSTPRGFIPGIREFAIYASRDELPAGLPGVAGGEGSESSFRTAGKSGFAREVRLAPGWAIEANVAWEKPVTPIQLIPTASGSTFLLTEAVSAPPQNGGDLEMHAARSAPTIATAVNAPSGSNADRLRRQVHLLSAPTDGGFSHSLFLDGLAPGTVIGWDGEWLYTFSGGKLEAYRNLTGEGPANERKRAGTVFTLPKDAESSDVEFSDMHLGDDGWLYVPFQSSRTWEAYDSRGETLQLPERGIARFQRSGKGFSEWHESKMNGGGMPFKESGVNEIAQVEGLTTAARDGRLLWTASTDDTGTTIACLEESSGEAIVPVLWDRVGDQALFGYLSSPRQSVRREVIPEILRRKRNPAR